MYHLLSLFAPGEQAALVRDRLAEHGGMRHCILFEDVAVIHVDRVLLRFWEHLQVVALLHVLLVHGRGVPRRVDDYDVAFDEGRVRVVASRREVRGLQADLSVILASNRRLGVLICQAQIPRLLDLNASRAQAPRHGADLLDELDGHDGRQVRGYLQLLLLLGHRRLLDRGRDGAGLFHLGQVCGLVQGLAGLAQHRLVHALVVEAEVRCVTQAVIRGGQ